jgi:hypothetical protein
MRHEFDPDLIQSVEFCVSVATNGDDHINYLVPIDQTVQDALKQVLNTTLVDIEPGEDDWSVYELSEKYGSKESLRADITVAEMAAVRSLYEEEGWEINARILTNPKKITYYFGVFRDNHGRILLGVRQATQFKGAFKGHFLSVIDDTLRMVPDHVFKLDNEFDFLITAQHVYILRPAGFERIAKIEEYASARARDMTLELADMVKFLDFGGLAEYVGKHKRAARLVATLHARTDLATIKRAMFLKSAEETGVALENVGRKLGPVRGSEIACLELLDNRRYITALKPGPKPAFVASSRRAVGGRGCQTGGNA